MNFSEMESAALNTLRPMFEKDGFEILDEIPRDILPSGLRGYIPDAVLKRKKDFIALEFKRSRNPSIDRKLQVIAQQFRELPNWDFRIFYLDEMKVPDGPSVQNEPIIVAALEQISKLLKSHDVNAAFLLSWAAFEAASRSKRPDFFTKPQSPGRIVTVLAENGDLSPDEAESARGLIPKRNSLIHGQLDATISPEDVKVMQRIILKVLEIGEI